jgi:hypothetical protein
VKVCSLLLGEHARRRVTVLGGPKPLESFLDYGSVLAMEVGMHLYVRCADVDFVTSILHIAHKRTQFAIMNIQQSDGKHWVCRLGMSTNIKKISKTSIPKNVQELATYTE